MKKIEKLIYCLYFIAPVLCLAQPSNVLIGASPNNEDGDPPRTAYIKLNGAMSFATPQIYYVSPWGNDLNNGSENFPFAKPEIAANHATNAGDTVAILPGINTNCQNFIQLSVGTAWAGSPGSLIVISNSLPGITSHAWFRPASSCTINYLRVWFLDTQGDSDTPIGFGQSDNGIACTNCVFNEPWVYSMGTGFHFEGISLSAGYSITWNNPTVIANDCCFQFQGIKNALMVIHNPTFTVTNFSTAGLFIAKPLRVVGNQSDQSSKLIVDGGVFNYSDVMGGPTNVAAYALWNNTTAQSNIVFNGVTLNPGVMTNANSADVFGSNTNVVFWKGVVRMDGKTFTETNALGAGKSSIISL